MDAISSGKSKKNMFWKSVFPIQIHWFRIQTCCWIRNQIGIHIHFWPSLNPDPDQEFSSQTIWLDNTDPSRELFNHDTSSFYLIFHSETSVVLWLSNSSQANENFSHYPEIFHPAKFDVPSSRVPIFHIWFSFIFFWVSHKKLNHRFF